MPWEYLDKPELDQRYAVAASALPQSCKPFNALDMNCGNARFRHYIHGYNQYFCNDTNIHPSLPPIPAPGFHFYCIDDAAMPRILAVTPIHILAAFGMGAGHIVHNGHESETLDATIRQFLHSHAPRYLIFEASAVWNRLHRHLSDLVIHANNAGYTIIKQWRSEHLKSVKSFEERILTERELFVLEIYTGNQ